MVRVMRVPHRIGIQVAADRPWRPADWDQSEPVRMAVSSGDPVLEHHYLNSNPFLGYGLLQDAGRSSAGPVH